MVAFTSGSENTLSETNMMFLHCKQCMKNIPHGESPRTYARLSVMVEASEFDPPMIVVTCERHDKLVAKLELAHEFDEACKCAKCKEERKNPEQ